MGLLSPWPEGSRVFLCCHQASVVRLWWLPHRHDLHHHDRHDLHQRHDLDLHHRSHLHHSPQGQSGDLKTSRALSKRGPEEEYSLTDDHQQEHHQHDDEHGDDDQLPLGTSPVEHMLHLTLCRGQPRLRAHHLVAKLVQKLALGV